jgi:hypothetical protein
LPDFHGHSHKIWFKIKSPEKWGRIEDERFRKTSAQRKMAAARKVCVLHLFKGAEFLLDLYVWFYDLLGLHGRKLLGNDL